MNEQQSRFYIGQLRREEERFLRQMNLIRDVFIDSDWPWRVCYWSRLKKGSGICTEYIEKDGHGTNYINIGRMESSHFDDRMKFVATCSKGSFVSFFYMHRARDIVLGHAFKLETALDFGGCAHVPKSLVKKVGDE